MQCTSTPHTPFWRSQGQFHLLLYRAVSIFSVAGSIPDGVIGIFHCHNPSGRTLALGLTQCIT